MKGTLSVVAALLLLNAAALTLWSRAAPPPVAARNTRVAVFNLTYVLKNYEKFKGYQIDLKKQIDPLEKIDGTKKKRAEKLAEVLKDANLTAERRAEIEKKVTRIQREIEDNKAEAQRLLVKEQERQLVTLYEDVETVSRRLAKERGIDLLLHYNDVVEKAELKSPANIARKMQAGALMPMVVEPGIDLSEAVLEELHKDMKKEEL